MSAEEQRYLPTSEFLVSVINEEVMFDESDFGRANVRMLIAMTKDDDRSNRDWAALLLGHHGPDTDEVLDALKDAAEDVDEYVRAEAISALVDRDRETALALVTRELSRDSACFAVFEAAEELAEPSLIPLLETFSDNESGSAHLNEQISDALAACRAV